MATIRRAGFGTVFELEDSKVGIGTDAATHTLQALGNIQSEDATDIGISSFTTYQGFVDKVVFAGAGSTNTTIDNQSQSGSTSGEIVIDGDVTVSSATTFTSGPQHLTVTDTFTLPSGDTNSRALKPTPGSLRFNQDFATLEFYTGNHWATVNTFTEMQNSPSNRGRGFFAGGFGPTNSGRHFSIDSINIQTQGNATNFGDLLSTTVGTGNEGSMGCGNEIRGVIGGGNGPSAQCPYIQYITTASEGDAINFGDLSQTRFRGSALSSSTRGIFGAGRTPSSVNTLDYVQIMTLGDAIDFGDLLDATNCPGSVSSPTRGLFNGGHTGTTRISAITIASKGDAFDFGDDPFEGGYTHGGGSTGVRGVWAGGYAVTSGSPYPVNKLARSIRGVTIASGGNAVEFGELQRSNGFTYIGGLSDKTRACWGGGYVLSPATQLNSIEYFQMNSGGNAKDFGDLTIHRSLISSLSDSHGGLGGF